MVGASPLARIKHITNGDAPIPLARIKYLANGDAPTARLYGVLGNIVCSHIYTRHAGEQGGDNFVVDGAEAGSHIVD